MQLDLPEALTAVEQVTSVAHAGRVVRVVGGVVEASGPQAAVGELCEIRRASASPRDHMFHEGSLRIAARRPPDEWIPAEVIGFRSDAILLMPLTGATGICPGALVVSKRCPLSVRVGPELLGRILDGLGRPIDDKGPIRGGELRSVVAAAPSPLDRRRITEPMPTGIRAIDGLMTCGRGQRLGIFAGSGIGKSVLIGSIARNAVADVNVIALIGERGREVREFLERDLKGGLARSVVIVATSDQPALVRIKGAMVALTIAEFFREQSADVLFMMDSLTRVAIAQREIGLAAGEPPTTRGYPPSVFAQLPRLLERVGTSAVGSITGLFAVLVESDDMNEPISDAARSILDGHIALSRRLAQKGHYPAIDVLAGVSRVMPQVVSPGQLRAAEEIRRVLAAYADAEDVINLGAYVPGSNQQVDDAIARLPNIHGFLKQRPEEASGWEETTERLAALAAEPALPAAPGPDEGKNFPVWEGSSQQPGGTVPEGPIR